MLKKKKSTDKSLLVSVHADIWGKMFKNLNQRYEILI